MKYLENIKDLTFGPLFYFQHDFLAGKIVSKKKKVVERTTKFDLIIIVYF
jgi:hypothetical protein